ncbi:MAG: hypothetical protein C4582_06100 [Desulfobacteraceae bacterium]|jgi:hypothetical protein|nr:MAG: hypothetical protein C4582_06100 [Desulfobacteraceae bacterium]
MPLLAFTEKDVATVSDALEIAEDVTANFFKFSTAQWKRHRYEVRTHGFLDGNETFEDVFAFIGKGFIARRDTGIKACLNEYYLICLQDHRILSAAQRDQKVTLLPLLLYIFTHELIHIVRFCSFLHRFEAYPWEREREERLVHELTYRALGGVSLPSLNYILDSYTGHRMCEERINISIG